MSVSAKRTPLDAWRRITELERRALEQIFAGKEEDVHPEWLRFALAWEGLAASSFVDGRHIYRCTPWGIEVWEAHALREAADVLETSR